MYYPEGPWWRWNGMLEATGPMLMKRVWHKWNRYDNDNQDEVQLAGKSRSIFVQIRMKTEMDFSDFQKCTVQKLSVTG